MGLSHFKLQKVENQVRCRACISELYVLQQVLLNERVVKAADGTHATEKGTRLDADVVYTCTGAKPCTGFMKKRFAACLDEQSRIKVYAVRYAACIHCRTTLADMPLLHVICWSCLKLVQLMFGCSLLVRMILQGADCKETTPFFFAYTGG